MVKKEIINKNENDIVSQILRLNKSLKRDFERRLLTYDLTSQQARCLLYITKMTDQGIEIHQNDVQQKFELSKSTMSGIIKRLIKKDVIIRTIHGPISILSPSQKGLSIIEEIHKHRLSTVNKLLKGFKESEKVQISGTISKLIENMSEEETIC